MKLGVQKQRCNFPPHGHLSTMKTCCTGAAFDSCSSEIRKRAQGAPLLARQSLSRAAAPGWHFTGLDPSSKPPGADYPGSAARIVDFMSF